MLTNQEIFNKVWVHLNLQKEAAVDDFCCRYRTSDGLMCAVGCLIPSEEYTVKFEGIDISGLLKNYPQLTKAMGVDPRESRDLLVSLQNAHDVVLNRGGLSEWRVAMELIAARFNLEIPE